MRGRPLTTDQEIRFAQVHALAALPEVEVMDAAKLRFLCLITVSSPPS
jgi:hypothetical protein